MFVPDITHQFFQNVFHGHDPAGTAELIQYHGDLRLLLLQFAHDLVDFFVGKGKDNGRNDLFDRLAGDPGAGVKILLVDHTDDVVDIILIDQQPGEFRFQKTVCDLFLCAVQGHGFQIHAGSQDVLCLQFGKLNGIAQEFAVILVDTAFLLHFIHKHEQFFLRHFVVAFQTEDLGKQFFPAGKEEIERREDPDQDPQERTGKDGKAFRAILGDAFGRNFPEDQNHHGDHCCGDRCTQFSAVNIAENQRGNGCHGNIDNIVPDQDGRDQFIVVLGKFAGEFRSPCAFFGKGFHARPVHGRIGGFRGGKVGGHCKQKNQTCDFCKILHCGSIEYLRA